MCPRGPNPGLRSPSTASPSIRYVTSSPLRFVVSGGPGSGKTTLLRALAAQGETCLPEVSRELIREQTRHGGSAIPWINVEDFSRACSKLMRLQLAGAHPWRRVFFDRGLPDLIGYLRCGRHEVPDDLITGSKEYTPLVFMAPPWPEIYVNDPERLQRYSEAVALGTHIRQAYLDLKFTIIDLARASVDSRVAHVRSILNSYDPDPSEGRRNQEAVDV